MEFEKSEKDLIYFSGVKYIRNVIDLKNER